METFLICNKYNQKRAEPVQYHTVARASVTDHQSYLNVLERVCSLDSIKLIKTKNDNGVFLGPTLKRSGLFLLK